MNLNNNSKKNKRNEFQKAEDKRFAIEMLSKGYTYQQIAAAISQRGPYTLSYQQVISDLNGVRLESLAEAKLNMLEIIDEEIQGLEKVLEEAWKSVGSPRELLKTEEFGTSDKTGDYRKTKEQWVNIDRPVAALRLISDAMARRSVLRGVDSYLKHQDINLAIEALTNRGYVVSLPDGDEDASASDTP
jgi:hypothetical protein